MDNDIVTLVVENKNYEFSKKILSERSAYFNAMFNDDFIEKNKETVKLEGVSACSWEYIMHYLKTRKIKQEKWEEGYCNEIIQLLQDASMFQFIDLKEKCAKILYQILESNNAIQILEIASKLDVYELMHKARAVALWNADEITSSDVFYNLSVDQVEGYLSDPALHCSSGEWGVWEAIYHWINSTRTSSSRDLFLPRLVKCLRLDLLSILDLKSISLYDSVRSFPTVVQALKIIIKGRMSKENAKAEVPALVESFEETEETSQSEEQADLEVQEFINEWLKTEPRKLPYVPAVVANINAGQDTTSPCIVKFNELEKKLIPTLRLDKVETSLGAMVGFKVIAYGSKLYMFGGETMTRQSSWNHAVWEYDQVDMTWKFLSNLLRPSRHMFGCCIDNDLYIMGGFGRHRLIQNDVSRLDVKTRIWHPCASLPNEMHSMPCCVFKGKIYVIESVVYQYSPDRDCWISLDVVLPRVRGFCNAMVNEKFIFLSGGYTKNVYKFDPSIPGTELEIVGTFKNECTQTCLVDEYIYSLSQDEFGEELYCEKINIDTGENVVLWEGTTGNEIANLDPKHRHGCFPLLSY